jgi:excisionase family DNA binding protein
MAEYLKLPEVARRLDVSEKTARRYVKAGALPSVFIGNAYRVSEEDLEEYLRDARVQPGDSAPKVLSPQPERDAVAASEALQGAVAIAWRLLAQRGQSIVDQSVREGASVQLSEDLKSYHADAARLANIRRRAIGVQVTDELAEAEDAYQEVESRIQSLLRQDIEASAEEQAQLQRFKRDKADNTEERGANAS